MDVQVTEKPVKAISEKAITTIFAIMTFCAVLPLYFEDTRQLCGLIFIGLMGYLFFSKRKPASYKISEAEMKWMAVSVIYAAIFIMSFVMREPYTDDGSWRIAAPAFILLFTVWYFLALRFNFQEKIIIYVAVFSILSAILLFILEVISIDGYESYRYGSILSGIGAAGFTVPITTVMLTIIWFVKRNSLYLVLALIGMFLVGLNGSRTGALIVLFPFFFLGLHMILKRQEMAAGVKLKLAISALLVIIILGFFSKNKVMQAFTDIKQMNQADFNTSLGQRYVMFKVGSDIAMNNLVLGVGPSNYKTALKDAFENYEYDNSLQKTIVNYTQIHNQYLMDLILSGFLGLASLALFVFSPMLYFYRRYLKSKEAFVLASVGLMLGLAFIMLFGAVFTYTYTTIIYFLAVSSIISFINSDQSNASK